MNVGTFAVTSGWLLVTDPCYKRHTWCTKMINALPGDWTSEATYSGGRVAELIVRHSSLSPEANPLWVFEDGEIGVNSGQCGFFDLDHYPLDETGEYDDETTFYGKVCAITLSEDGAGTLDFGAVSSSGWGDGVYDLYTTRDENDNVVGAKLVFIPEDVDLDEDEDEEDYEEEYDDEEEEF